MTCPTMASMLEVDFLMALEQVQNYKLLLYCFYNIRQNIVESTPPLLPIERNKCVPGPSGGHWAPVIDL